jgi:hypothetical protein
MKSAFFQRMKERFHLGTLPIPVPPKRGSIEEKLSMLSAFENQLADAQKKRAERRQWVPSTEFPDGRDEPGWVQFERHLMFGLVNRERSARRLPPMDIGAFIAKAEDPAVGHSDYTHKFALYSTELAIELA